MPPTKLISVLLSDLSLTKQGQAGIIKAKRALLLVISPHSVANFMLAAWGSRQSVCFFGGNIIIKRDKWL